jgi:hypothetical protein
VALHAKGQAFLTTQPFRPFVVLDHTLAPQQHSKRGTSDVLI